MSTEVSSNAAGNTGQAAGAQPSAPAKMSRESVTIIATLLVATFVVILNETIMNVALQRLMVDLGVDAPTVQWLATGFMLTMAVVIPTTGFILQSLSTRAVFMLAMGLFTGGTALAAAAPGFEILLLARIIQAGGTAIMLPLLMTTILTLVPVARRGAVMGNVSIAISVAPAMGPTVSGLILEHFTWRFMFVFVLLDLRAFNIRMFTVSVLLMVVAMMALFGGVILLPLYLQEIRGLGSLETGLVLLPGGLAMGLLGPVIGRIFDKVGPLPLTLSGSVLMVLALWQFSMLDAGTPVWWIVTLHVGLSFGLAFLFTPAFTTGLNPLPPHLYSHGSAIMSTSQQVAGAAGTALLVSIFAFVSASSGMVAGMNAAFLAATVIAAAAVVLSAMTRKTEGAGAGHGAHSPNWVARTVFLTQQNECSRYFLGSAGVELAQFLDQHVRGLDDAVVPEPGQDGVAGAGEDVVDLAAGHPEVRRALFAHHDQGLQRQFQERLGRHVRGDDGLDLADTGAHQFALLLALGRAGGQLVGQGQHRKRHPGREGSAGLQPALQDGECAVVIPGGDGALVLGGPVGLDAVVHGHRRIVDGQPLHREGPGRVQGNGTAEAVAEHVRAGGVLHDGREVPDVHVQRVILRLR